MPVTPDRASQLQKALLPALLVALSACGAAPSGDGTPPSTCGDGVAAPDEACDGLDLDGATCASLGFAGGRLACDAACSGFATAACTTSPVCGDDQAVGAE